MDPRHRLQRQQSLFSVPHARGVAWTGIQLQQLIVSFRPTKKASSGQTKEMHLNYSASINTA